LTFPVLCEDATNLEIAAAQSPNDLTIRTKLVKCYSLLRFTSAEAEENTRRHILWIIKNHPEAEVAGLPDCSFDPVIDKQGYDEAKHLWLDQTKSNPTNTTILGHAAQFFLVYDNKVAEEILKRAKGIEPNNPQWCDELGHLYMLVGREDEVAAKQAMEEFETAGSLDASESGKFYRLSELSEAAFEAGEITKATKYANNLLEAAPKFRGDWNYGNAIYKGNDVLGRIALNQGDLQGAARYLLRSGRTPGSPQLNTFGPDMSLAKKLLQRGEKDAVLQYLELCRKFWSMGGTTLDDWTNAIKIGKIPDSHP